MEDDYNLERFVEVQNPIFGDIVDELRSGRKRTHWMWFVFPQIAGLGSSATAQRYAIRSLGEAKAYLAHDVLGPRLRETTAAVQQVRDCSATQIFGFPDDMKFRSSMTLFAQAAPDDVFDEALRTFFDGIVDEATLARLA